MKTSTLSGWNAVGPKGKRKECLDWIESHWTDMRPKSLIDAMEKARQERGEAN